MYIGPVLVMTRGGGQVCRFLGLMRVEPWDGVRRLRMKRVVVFLFVTATMYVARTAFGLTSQKWYGCVLRGRRLGPSINRRPPFGVIDGASECKHSLGRGRREKLGRVFFFLSH